MRVYRHGLQGIITDHARWQRLNTGMIGRFGLYAELQKCKGENVLEGLHTITEAGLISRMGAVMAHALYILIEQEDAENETGAVKEFGSSRKKSPGGTAGRAADLCRSDAGSGGSKKVKFCSYKLGLAKNESHEDCQLTVQDYWPDLPPLEQLPPHKQEELPKQLSTEVVAFGKSCKWKNENTIA